MEKTIRILNLIYLIHFRCKFEDQYCCGYICCQKAPGEVDAELLGSWYFWSIISILFIVFGCIVCSFTLSTFKKRTYQPPASWMGLLSGSANLRHLATTTVGENGIIQPNISYKEKSKTSKTRSRTARLTDVEESSNNQTNSGNRTPPTIQISTIEHEDFE